MISIRGVGDWTVQWRDDHSVRDVLCSGGGLRAQEEVFAWMITSKRVRESAPGRTTPQVASSAPHLLDILRLRTARRQG